MGRQRIADTLARAGLHLSSSTARRMLRKTVADKTPPPKDAAGNAATNSSSAVSDKSSSSSDGSEQPKRAVTAKYPGHVWHVDFSAVPTCMGFWIPWFPQAWAQHWPFCFWIAVVVDHLSRKAVLVRCFRSNPTAAELTETLDIAIATVKITPKYLISDKGSQFREDYLDWCDARGIKPRFGAIGHHGSVAVVERFIRTLKQECVRRIVVPLATEAFERELLTYVRWYNEHRPHRTLGGRTPNEVHEGRSPARELPAFETRQEPKARRAGGVELQSHARQVTQLRLVVKHFEDRKHLPVIELERAA